MVSSAKASMGSYSLITKWTFGNCLGELGDDRQQREPDTGREAADAHGACRLGVRVEVEACAVDGRQDRDGVLGEALARRV